MSPNNEKQPITKANLNTYLKDLAKEYRKLAGKGVPAEIILTGGAAVLTEYGFRELTYDVDAIIVAASAMKSAIARVSDKHSLPHGWLNMDFKHTASYSNRLQEVSVFYKTFSNVLTIRMITGEYLLAMKLKSGRRYKNDLSDIVGILWEHQKKSAPITQESVEKAILLLYGNDVVIPETSVQLLDNLFDLEDYEPLYRQIRDSEIEARELLLDFDSEYPNLIKGKNIDTILDSLKHKHDTGQKKTLLSKLEEMKRLINAVERPKDKSTPVSYKGNLEL